MKLIQNFSPWAHVKCELLWSYGGGDNVNQNDIDVQLFAFASFT